MYKSFNPNKLSFFLYLAPGLLVYTFIVFVPVLGAAYYSFFNWPGGTKKTFILFDNYTKLIQDSTFWGAFGNNIKLTLICIVGQIGVAFILAILLSSKLSKFKSLHRTVSYFPVTLSAVVIGFIWSMIYDYNYGLLNFILKQIGLEQHVQPWLSNSKIALYLVAIPLIWQYVGYYLVIILAAFSSVDNSIFEMAEIDGCTGFQKAIYITMPMIKNTLLVCVTLCIAGNLKTFDHIYVMTGGGPGSSTMVMSLYSYNTSFLQYKMGYGSAISVGILVISLFITFGSRLLMSVVSRGDKD